MLLVNGTILGRPNVSGERNIPNSQWDTLKVSPHCVFWSSPQAAREEEKELQRRVRAP